MDSTIPSGKMKRPLIEEVGESCKFIHGANDSVYLQYKKLILKMQLVGPYYYY
jgi:hypothetical protein